MYLTKETMHVDSKYPEHDCLKSSCEDEIEVAFVEGHRGRENIASKMNFSFHHLLKEQLAQYNLLPTCQLPHHAALLIC